MHQQVGVSICDIEPRIYDMARSYFGLPNATGKVYLSDARVTLPVLGIEAQKYNYIIHDVFTGGAVPASLFTTECWTSVKNVLADKGVVAVNFAGKLQSKAADYVICTLMDAFQACRAFNDGELRVGDHTNMVIFCTQEDKLFFSDPPLDSAYSSQLRQGVSLQ